MKVRKLNSLTESSGSINEIEVRREVIHAVIIIEDLISYPSYAVYYSLLQEPVHLVMVYIYINDIMVPRVKKRNPEEHNNNWKYAISLDGFAFKIEEFFEKEGIPFQKFADIKESEDIAIDIESEN